MSNLPTPSLASNESPWAARTRLRKTHFSDAICRFFKSMSLKDRLEKNCAIERENSVRLQREYARLCAAGPAATHPSPDTDDAASMITIDEEEKALLMNPMMYEAYKDMMPKYLVLELVQRFSRGAGSAPSLKRKASSSCGGCDGGGSRGESCQPARKMVKGESVEADQSCAPPDPFPAAMLLAEIKRPLPLTWYSNKALALIRSPLPSQATLVNSLWTRDPAEITEAQNPEETFPFLHEAGMTHTYCSTYDEYLECIENHKQVYALLDSPTCTAYKDWADSHHSFYTSKPNARLYYDYWKKEEKKNRDARARTPTFNYHLYENGWADCEVEYKRDHPPPHNPAFTCVLCARNGHPVESHDDFHHGSTFPGPNKAPFWAKKRPDSPDGLYDHANRQSVCKTYNRIGSGHCNHGSSRLHVCSFCGSCNHYALSWTCRRRTY